MFVQGFGEVLTDIMTVNPAISDIPSASAILDTSNFTFQAVSFGKDAGGFEQHSHAVSSIQYLDDDSASAVSAYDSGILTLINYASDKPLEVSSYVLSTTYQEFSSTYNSMPNDPSPLDTRLERGSTKSNNLSGYVYASALPDSGHYANPILDTELSAIWNKVGGFAPSGGADFHFYDKSKNLLFTGTLSSSFNASGVMDKNGYLTISSGTIIDSAAPLSPTFSGGAVVASSVGFAPSTAGGIVRNEFRGGDAMSLVAFGSVRHFGIYCLDLKTMLASGLTPPYAWNYLNNNRKYKLVAKATILENPLFHRDTPDVGLGAFSGFTTWLKSQSVVVNLTLDFK